MKDSLTTSAPLGYAFMFDYSSEFSEGFGLQLAVQIRILREIKAQQGAPNAAQAQPIRREFTSLPPYSNDLALSPGQSLPSDPSVVLPQIVSHHQERFIQDYHLDTADLKRVIQEALSSGSDAQLVEV